MGYIINLSIPLDFPCDLGTRHAIPALRAIGADGARLFF